MNTSSLAWPNMFNVAQNSTASYEDSQAIASRIHLLLRTQPTELYMNPTFGVNLKQYMWQYNVESTRALIKQTIRDQIQRYEPKVDPTSITFIDRERSNDSEIGLTVLMLTTFGQEVSVDI